MSLHAEYELVGSSVDDRFNDAVGRPGNGLEIPADDIYGLMMMTIDRRVSRFSQLCNERILGDVNRVRAPPKQIALHVFERVFDFGLDVLDQRASPINVQRLDTKKIGRASC